MNKCDSILVIDSENMISIAIIDMLKKEGYSNVSAISSQTVDFMNADALNQCYNTINPKFVFCFAGPHGGISANIEYPAEFIYKNLVIQNNIIHGAYLNKVEKLLFMTGGCIYPKECNQLIRETDFMTGVMEPTSVAYSTAKAAGIEMCIAYNRQYGTEYIPAALSNYYGPGDDISEQGHVLASIMYKMYSAKKQGKEKLELYGTGKPLRQFLYIDDLAQGAILIMEKMKTAELINIAGGEEISIKELAMRLQRIIGYTGKIVFDINGQDGTLRKLLDNEKLRALGWNAQTDFDVGLKRTYEWFKQLNQQ